MKVKIEIECTPREAREAMGLPDVTPLQEEWLKRVEERMSAVEVNHLMTDDVLKNWASGSAAGVQAMSNFFEAFVNPALSTNKKK